ncbi:MogA/MoaB family molybdenum cofactor biosynthesis protein [Microbacterium sp. LWH7-1.2]|jgi:molybdenum cofactor synthesis domain-containing protein|uniref:MogA/MoaB family molybdenum cofactor biosynthesis protein n=1 Tax=Microbacterium sp. LWH7-1.2 TaxID=3135257 RepID=UPI00313A43C2
MTRAAVVTVSDRSAGGSRTDESGPIAVAALREAGFDCADAVVVPDGADSVERALTAEVVAGVKLIVTTGGTGVSPRDQTPEGTARVVTRQIPGISEELRRRGAAEKPVGMLTRGVAGVVDPHGVLVVNLPGSPGGVASGMPVVVSVARHVLDQLGGSDH